MARKYYGYMDDINGQRYTVEIWDGPNGLLTAGTQLPLAADGFILDQQGEGDYLWENVIRKTKATAYFVVNNTADHTFFQGLGVDDEDKYALVIWKGSTLHWVGRILSDMNQYELRPELNTTYQITGVDCLALMDQYYVDPTWFSAADRLNMLDLIRLSLKQTNLDLYWNHLGESDNYILDSVESDTPRVQALKKYEVNKNSVIDDYSLYYTQSVTDAEWRGWITCEQAFINILTAMEARIMLENGRYVTYQPVEFGVAITIYYSIYGTDGVWVSNGSYAHQTAVNTGLNQRQKFQSFPIVTHQPAIKQIKFTWTRKAYAREVRPYSGFSTADLTVGSLNAAQGPDIFVYANLKYLSLITPGPTSPAPATTTVVGFRIYSYNSTSGQYKHYDYANKTWVNAGGVPNWEQIQVKILSTTPDPTNTINTVNFDFSRNFSSSVGVNDLYCDFQVLVNYKTALGPLSPSGVAFWGNANLWQEENLPKQINITNTANVTATESIEIKSLYAQNVLGLMDQGMIYDLNNTPSIRGTWPNMDESISAGLLARNGYDWMSVYKFSPVLLQGIFHDSGAYNRTKTIFFDSNAYVWQGGRFYAQSCRYEGEWLRMKTSFTDIVTGGENDSDTIDFNQQGDSAVRRLFQASEDLRESINASALALPYRLAEVAPGAPTTDPIIDTTYDVKVYYDTSDSLLKWDVQEEGKTLTYTAGTYTLSGTAEVIICDTTAGAIEINLPDPTTNKGRRYIFKKTGIAHDVTIVGTIDDNGETTINAKNESVTIVSDGTQYWIIAQWH